MPYTGEVTPGGPAESRDRRRPRHHQGGGRPRDVQQLLPAALRLHRGPGAHRRRRGTRDAAAAHRRRRAHDRRDHPPALGPPPRSGRRGVGNRRPGRGRGSRRRGHHEADRRPGHSHGGRRRHRRGGRLRPLRHHHRRAHARLDRPGLRRPRRPPAPVHRRLALPRWRRKHPWRQGQLPQPHRRRGDQDLRHPPRRHAGSTPATATTRPSASSARTSPSGASGAGGGPHDTDDDSSRAVSLRLRSVSVELARTAVIGDAKWVSTGAGAPSSTTDEVSRAATSG